jgi:TonB-linked SusC/RagA family outer membrane protein
MLSVQALFAQQTSITGVVTDNNGETLPGVNISIQGTTTGVVSDGEGRYRISVPGSETVLSFSFIGYVTQEIAVGDRREINVSLSEEATSIEEVVVIGYGVARKSDLTGAVVRADLSAMQNFPNVNMVQALKGTVAGLTVGTITAAGQEPSVSIRGRNSISGTTSPLIVLDGIIYRGNLNDINPSDIESVDILKDASSAAIYGSQAANGVMLITTKTVRQMSKPVIEYNGTVSFQKIMNNKLKMLNREEYLQQLADTDIAHSRMGADLSQKNPNWDPTGLFYQTSVGKGYANGTDFDWWDVLTVDVPYIQNHNISLRGKTELATYFLSFGYMDQKNLIKNDTYKRYNMRINLDTKITDWLNAGTQSFFSSNDMSGENPSFSNMLRISALSTPYDDNGEIEKIQELGQTNPLLLFENPNKEVRYNLTGNFYADISIPFIKGLSYRLNYSRNMTIGKYFSFDPYANALQGSAQKNNNSGYSWTLDNIVTYKRIFGKHSVNATAVYGVEKRGYESTNASAKNFSNQTLGYNYLPAAQSDQNVLGSSAWEESSLYIMGRASYTYNDRYIATATIRRDGFSGFGKTNKIGYFPSAALAWRISEENFIKNNVNWVDNLKLRLSYGSNGNRTVSRYSTMAQMSTLLPIRGSNGGYIYGDGATPELAQGVRTMPNSDLKWETTTSFNFGMDFSTWNGRLSGVYEFYNSKTSNLLYDISIPNMNGAYPNSGYNLTIPTNIGKLQNVGHEITITGIPVHRGDFEWTVVFNYARNRNKVLSILDIDANGDGKEDDLVDAKIFINKPLGVVYDYEIIGMWQVSDYNQGLTPNGFTYGTYKVRDIDEDKSYSPEKDRKILGYTDPAYSFNVQNILKYKGWELRIVVNSIQGGKDYYYGQPLATMWTTDQMRNYAFLNNFDYWTPENPNAKYRQLGAYTAALGYAFSPYVQRNFIRLQELTLAYNFPVPWLKKMGINRARLYVSGNNLLTITKWDGWDPEANLGVTQYINGYPTMKNYSIGLNFEF